MADISSSGSTLVRRVLRFRGSDSAMSSDHGDAFEALVALDRRQVWGATEPLPRSERDLASEAETVSTDAENLTMINEVTARHMAVKRASARFDRTRKIALWVGGACALATIPAVWAFGLGGWAVAVIAGVSLVAALRARVRVKRASKAEAAALSRIVASLQERVRAKRATKTEAAALTEAAAVSHSGHPGQRGNAEGADEGLSRTIIDLTDAKQHVVEEWQALVGEIPVEWGRIYGEEMEASPELDPHTDLLDSSASTARNVPAGVPGEPQRYAPERTRIGGRRGGARVAGAHLRDPGSVPDAQHAPRHLAGPVPPRQDALVQHRPDRHSELGLTGGDVVGMYRMILRARVLDEKIRAMHRMGKAATALSTQGHEGAQVGSAWALKAGHDVVLPYHRDTGVMLTLGMTVDQILLAVLARADDPNSGARQPCNHWGWPDGNVITGSSLVATQLPHAAGLAYAAKLRGDDRVVVSYFSEGATSRGDFHEALEFAGAHQLPMVFICENDGYEGSEPRSFGAPVDDVADRAYACGFGGVIVDGNDPFDVYATVRSAMGHARRGAGPTLVECKTYRYLAPISEGRNGTYQTPKEIEAWRRKDPLRRIARYLLDREMLSAAAMEQIEAGVKAEVDLSAKVAEGSASPRPATAYAGVFAQPLRPVPGAPAGASDATIAPVAMSMPRATTERSVVDTLRWTRRRIMASDERVVILGAGVGLPEGPFQASDGLTTEFGEGRVLETPLAESAIIGIGIGLALAGLRPIVEIQAADFIHSGFDQLVSEAARIHYRSNGGFAVPLVVRAPWGGGGRGGLYRSQSIEATYAHVPGLKVVVPSTPADVCGMLRTAVEDADPVLFLEHQQIYQRSGPVPDDDGWRVPIGLAEVARTGDDLTVVTYGLHRHLCLEAAQVLSDEDGASVEVVDLRTISPLDRDTVLGSVARTGRCLVVHEDNLSFGVGAEVAAMVASDAFWELDAPVRRLATADVPNYPFAGPLEAELFIDTPKIIQAMRSILRE